MQFMSTKDAKKREGKSRGDRKNHPFSTMKPLRMPVDDEVDQHDSGGFSSRPFASFADKKG
jgi:hypothetical protein